MTDELEEILRQLNKPSSLETISEGERIKSILEIRWTEDGINYRIKAGTKGVIAEVSETAMLIRWANGQSIWYPIGDKLESAIRAIWKENTMAGRKPDSNVLVATEYENHEGKQMAFTEVGAAWTNDNGTVWFNIITMPGVRFCIKKREEKKEGNGAAQQN